MKLPNFTLPQLLALMVFFATLSYLWSILCFDQIIWKQGTLKYSAPSIPVDFQDNGRPPPRISLPNTSIECEDGQQLYRRGHLKGWKTCREHFFQSEKRALPEKSDDLEPNTWGRDHYYRAESDGYRDCLLYTSDAADE